MHITKIELEDIKSHVDTKFEFERGTTAIIGENGSGKTTLIEAVAWTLFDLLDYKKDDFVRRGAKKGIARVTFESSLDERQYLVYRDTGTSYYVYDPKLKTRIADKKEEVTRFLRQHLGVEAGTDLESLFRRAIGVPQGTFTAIFFETPTARKKAFDKLLKVEEYRESADKLRETVKYLEGKTITARENIARSEGELTNFDQLETDYKAVRRETKKLHTSTKELEALVRRKQKIVKVFEKVEETIKKLTDSWEKLKNRKSNAEIILLQKEREKSAADDAASKIKEAEADHQDHVKALGMLKELERERGEREKFRTELAKVEAAIVNVKAEQKTTGEDLKKVYQARTESKKLEPKAKEQGDLEKGRESLRNLISDTKSAESRIEVLEEKISKLRLRYRENQQGKNEAQEKSVEAKFLKDRQQLSDKLRGKLTNLRVTLERDKEFQSEIKNGLCPILSQKCLNLKRGQTLDDFVTTRFSDVNAKIDNLEIEQKNLEASLWTAREAEKFVIKLDSLKKREGEIANEGAALKKEKDSLKKDAQNITKLKNDLAKIEAKLGVLDNPRARIRILEKEATHEISLREQVTSIESNLQKLESDRRLKIEQLETYKDLDSNWKEFSDMRDKTSEAHRLFLANESLAGSLTQKKKDFEIARKELNEVEKDLEQVEKDLKVESKEFEAEKYKADKEELTRIERNLVEANLNQNHQKKRETQLKDELVRLKEISISLKTEVKKKERLQKISDMTAFIRATLKEAAPRVARNYVYHISSEANQMFREITGNVERTLKWADNYGIFLEENGYERPFQNLSGGEQMAAALSVRLALLKQLSDVRIAFFDEPTTNMDAERRELLAEQISQITEKQTFDQLFVISHDDTFEDYVDRVIPIQADDNR